MNAKEVAILSVFRQKKWLWDFRVLGIKILTLVVYTWVQVQFLASFFNELLESN